MTMAISISKPLTRSTGTIVTWLVNAPSSTSPCSMLDALNDSESGLTYCSGVMTANVPESISSSSDRLERLLTLIGALGSQPL